MYRIPIVFLLGLLLISPVVQAGSPVPVKEVVSKELLVASLEEQLETLTKLLAEEEKYDDNEEFIIRAGGAIACLSQALIEHDGPEKTEVAAPALRDAGLALQDYAGHEACVETLGVAQAAMKGESTGEHAKEHAWDELVGMYEMMEEMSDRNGGLSRSLRRPRGKISEQVNAATNAVLSIAMLSDHSYLEDDSQADKWDEWSKQCLDSMVGLISAIKEKDRDKVAEHYKAANRACDQCHEVFRAE